MNRPASPAPRHFGSAIALMALLPAQGVLTLPAGTGDDPRSVRFIANGHVVVSDLADGWQHFVDVTNTSNPTLTTSLNPPYGDQWFEAEYTRDYGGRLFTAHRGGGINMIDVSNPNAPTTVASFGTVYHFRGLRYASNGINGALYYNATNQGLEVCDVLGLGTVLSPTWNNFRPNDDGNGLELLGNHLYQLGAPPGNPNTRVLETYDVTNPVLPLQCNAQTLLGQQVGGHAHIRKLHLAGTARMVASR